MGHWVGSLGSDSSVLPLKSTTRGTTPTMSPSTTPCSVLSLLKEGFFFFDFQIFLVYQSKKSSIFISILIYVFGLFCRNFLLRDAYDDMMLDGVKPNRDTFHSLVVGTMRGSRMQDAFYFLNQMKIMGLVPDVCISVTFYNLILTLGGGVRISSQCY